MNKNITPTVEGGLLTAIAVVLGLASTYLPIVGALIEFFCPAPFVVLTVRRGVKIGLAALFVSFILLTLFASPIVSVRIVLTLNLCGVVLGYLITKKISTVKSFIATFLSAAISQMFMVGILALVMDINFGALEVSTMKEAFAESLQLYENIGLEQAQINQMREQISKIIELIAYLIPLILTLIALINAIACYLTSQWIFKKLQIEFLPPLPDFAEWKFPAVFLYISAFATLGMYWGDTREWHLLFTVSINILIFTLGIGLVQGFSLLSFFADRYNISKFWRRMFFVLILLNGLLTQILAFAGLFDMLFDYRKKLDS